MAHYTHKQAVVIGSGIAGLVAARVLTEHFEKVAIVERDMLLDTPAARNGVPQGRHPHLLLKRGEMILEQLFPGLGQKLNDSGAMPLNVGQDFRWFALGQWRPSYTSSINTIGASRPLLETTVRRYLAKNPQVDFLSKSEVIGLETSADGTKAIGLRVRSRSSLIGHNSIAADFIVDASGRDSAAPEWLRDLGFPLPEETVVNGFSGYASRLYRAKTGMGWKGMYIQPFAPEFTRGGIILPMEENIWQVCMIGMAKDYPPTDEKGFMEFALSLPSSEIYDAIKDAEPLSSISGFRPFGNRLFHYERLPRYLENFVLIGDSLNAFNPVYGQGMSVAAMSAIELGNCLREHLSSHDDLTGLAQHFQQKVVEVTAFPWQIAISEDARWSATEGNMPAPTPEDMLMQNYLANVLIAANINPNVLEAFYSVLQMIESPEIFFRPDIVMQVMALSNAVIPELTAVFA
ncbi:MAG TPA: FAD-dependent monooxygenase [Phototrophicaceae bacterium]|jgi:2-polyprenyl-6-methoxyphenol hydroxylase-like FAD-dependent oxidoreductase|nr:FAD-dependent monooxygenase [Phototrophicaceae bacterium]